MTFTVIPTTGVAWFGDEGNRFHLSERLTLILWVSGPGLFFGMGPSWAGRQTVLLSATFESDAQAVLEAADVQRFMLMVAMLLTLARERERCYVQAVSEGALEDPDAYTRQDAYALLRAPEQSELEDFIKWLGRQQKLSLVP